MSRPIRVLIVEDSEDDALLVVRELKTGGYDPVFERVDTPEAMEMAVGRQLPDIVIADYAMPRFSGLAALNLLRKKKLDIPFILLSGKIGEDKAVEAMKAGAHDYIMKDNLTRLVSAIERESKAAEMRKRHKKAEEALQQSEKYFRFVIDSAPEAIFIQSQDSFVYVNNAAIKLFGAQSKDQLVDQPIMERIHPDYRSAMEECIKKINEDRESVCILEQKYLRLDNSVIDVEASVILYAFKEQRGTLFFVRDVTKRKIMEKELQDRVKISEGFASVAVDRELVMMELKRKIQELEALRIKPISGNSP